MINRESVQATLDHVWRKRQCETNKFTLINLSNMMEDLEDALYWMDNPGKMIPPRTSCNSLQAFLYVREQTL